MEQMEATSLLTEGGLQFQVWWTDNGDFEYSDNLKFVHIPESVTSIESGILYSTPAYICSDIDNCTAKEYADENGIEFRVCDGCHISIANHKEISVDYKSKLIFHANVK